MEDWKHKQQLYHLTQPINDDISDKEYIIRHDKSQLVEDIVLYFKEDSDILIYPSKSYAVAIIYAKLLERYFNKNFYEVLDDPKLLYDNDMYFVPYSKDKETYDDAISQIDLSFTNPIDQVSITIEFFKNEFFINTYKINL